MRKQLGLLIGLTIVGGIALPASGGGGAAVSMEKSLLNIRILQSYKKVLARYGQPNRIYQRNEAFDFIPAVDVKGNPTGGVKGLADMEQPASPGANTAGFGGGMMGGRGAMGGPRMGGGSMGGAMGAPRMGGSMGSGPSMSGYGGGASSGPPPGMMGGSMAGMMSRMGGGGSMGGSRGMGGGMMAGAGGSMGGGGGMMPGAPPAAGMMGGGGGAAASEGDGYRASGGYVWVYLFREKELAYTFHFNKDGRVEMIGQFGWRLGIPTSKNVKLGDPVKNVYSTYGYPDNMLQQGDILTLLYNQKHHAQFDIQNNKVTGIAIFLHESQKFERGAGGASGGASQLAGAGGGAIGGGRGRPVGAGSGGGKGPAGID